MPAEKYEGLVPAWVAIMHLLFLGFTVWMAHHQNKLEMRGPMLVGFFLVGIVVHGGCKAGAVAVFWGAG